MNLGIAVLLLLLAVIALAVTVIRLAIVVIALRGRVGELECELERRTQYVPLFEPVRKCRACGCDDDVVVLAGCWWVQDDLCSSCADDAACSTARGERP